MTYPDTPNRKAHAQGSSASAGTGHSQSDSPENRKGYGYSSGSVGQALANAFPHRRGATRAAAPIGSVDCANPNTEEAVDPFKRTSFKLAPDEYAEIANHRPTPEPLERIFDTTTIGRIFRFHHPDGGGTETGPFWRNWMWVPVALLVGSAFIVGGYLALKTRMHSTTRSTMAARTAPELPVESESGGEPQSPAVVKQVNVPSSEREGSIDVKPVTGNAEANIGDKAPASSSVPPNVEAKAVSPGGRASDQSTKPFVEPARVTPKVTLSRENGNAPKARRTPKSSHQVTPKSVSAKKAEDTGPATPYVKAPFGTVD